MRSDFTSAMVLAGAMTQRKNVLTRGRTPVRGSKRISRTKGLLVFAAAGVAALIGDDAYGANATWNGTTNGNWATGTNWSAATPTTGNVATFNNAGNTNTTINIDDTVGRSVLSMQFTTNAVSYTVGSGGANADDLLSLGSSGNISILAGLINTGLTQTINAPLSLGGNYTFTNSQLGAGSSLVIAGSVTNSIASTLTLNGAGTGTNQISGAIGVGAALQKVSFTSTGTTWALSGNNGYAGGTTINSTGGTLQIGSNTAFGASTGDILFTKGTIEAIDAARTLANNISEYNGTIPNGIGIIQGSQNLTFNGMKVGASNTRTLKVTNAGVTTFANLGLSAAGANGALAITGTGAVNIGVLSNGGGTGTGNSGGASSNLIYAGSNTLKLSGANIHTGITTLTSGTIEVTSLANGGRTFTVGATPSGSTLTVTSVGGVAGLISGQTIVTAAQSGGNSSLSYGTTIADVGLTSIDLSSPLLAATAANTVAFAGSPNGLGISTNAATNVVFNGGTLKYTGAAVQTDRLFTLGGGGGTIDSSGGGLLEFTNTGPIGTATANRVATANGSNIVTFTNLVNNADLSVGMTVTAPGGFSSTITEIIETNSVKLAHDLVSGTPTLSFSGPARTLNLTGSSAGSLAGILGNPTGTTASLSKTGGGTWILKGANTYSGGTAVSNGALLVDNATGSGTGTGAVGVTGTGTILGGLGTIAPGGSNGVTVGSGSLVSPGGNSAGDTVDTLKLNGDGTDGTLLTMSPGAKFAVQLNATSGTIASPGQSDMLVILNAEGDDVAFNNTVIDLSTGALAASGYYKLFDTDFGSGTWSGLTLSGQVITGGLTLGTVPSNAVTTQLILGDGAFGNAGDIYLSVAVPEPTSPAGLLLAGGAAVLGQRRTRQLRYQ